MSERWTYDQAKGVYRCAFPGCQYQSPNLGAMQLHSRRKDHAAWAAGGGQAAGADPPARRGPQKCPDCGGTEFRLLRRSVPEEAEALEAGFKAVCTKCQELV